MRAGEAGAANHGRKRTWIYKIWGSGCAGAEAGGRRVDRLGGRLSMAGARSESYPPPIWGPRRFGRSRSSGIMPAVANDRELQPRTMNYGRSSLAPMHILAAALLRDESRRIEVAVSSEPRRHQRKQALNAAAIVEAYAYVEATVNEFFAECIDSVDPKVQYPGLGISSSPIQLGTEVVRKLADAWEVLTTASDSGLVDTIVHAG